jgi:hypothetical protein
MRLNLDFTRSLPIVTGKKTERLPIACSEEFKQTLSMVANLLGQSPSQLAHRYVVEGMIKDLGNIMLAQPMAAMSLREVVVHLKEA